MRLKARTLEALYALFLLLPFLFTLLVFFLYAFLRAVYFSFTDYDLFSPPRFVGVENYLRLFREPLFLTALKHTLAYSLVVTALQTFFALLLAIALNRPLKGITFFRTVYYLPSVVSTAAASLLLLWLFQRTGLVNQGLSFLLAHLPHLLALGLLFLAFQGAQVAWARRRGERVAFFDPAFALLSVPLALLGTYALGLFGWIGAREVRVEIPWLPTTAKFLGIPYPLWAIILMSVWKVIGYNMIIFLVGIRDIPDSYLEAATIDGGNKLQVFRFIILPLLRPILLFVTI
ncbi:carbohydrate ABC transporter permease, partial [Thermus sp.]|uniref:carbohydrate ABC transporter permease n=1 Tax=Thermus sp. TaxID=275 RepID=UPI003D0F5B85